MLVLLHNTDLGGDFHSVMSGGEADVSLLGTVGADEGVNLDGLDLVEGEDGALDLSLGGASVNEEGEGVVFFDLLHGHVSDEGRLNNAEFIPRGLDGLGVGVRLGGLGAAVGVGGAAELRASVSLALRDADDLLGGGGSGSLGNSLLGSFLLGGLLGDGGDGSLGSVGLGSHCFCLVFLFCFFVKGVAKRNCFFVKKKHNKVQKL